MFNPTLYFLYIYIAALASSLEARPDQHLHKYWTQNIHYVNIIAIDRDRLEYKTHLTDIQAAAAS
jgi:hypothetical protein